MKLEEVVVSKFSVQEVKLNNKTIILPKLDGLTLPDIKLPKTLLSHYGVPKIGQYFKTDNDRMFLQLPVNDDLIPHLTTLDEYLSSNTMKQELFKAPGNTYEYSPILRYGSKGPYIKLKLETDYATSAIETLVWHLQRLTNSSINRNTTPMEINSVDDFANDDLIPHLNTLDEYLGCNTMKQELFKAPGNTYEYSPILRYGSKGPYIKLK